MKYLETTATISAGGLYRYDLTRLWDRNRDTIVFCMLNPSTADAGRWDGDRFIGDDPTIRRCVGFVDRFGYGRLVVVNLFAFRATNPSDMLSAEDPVGPDNDEFLTEHSAGRVVVCAWGATKMRTDATLCPGRIDAYRNRPREVARLISRAGGSLRHLGRTKAGLPKHPLYLPAETELQAFATKQKDAGV